MHTICDVPETGWIGP